MAKLNDKVLRRGSSVSVDQINEPWALVEFVAGKLSASQSIPAACLPPGAREGSRLVLRLAEDEPATGKA